MEKSEDTGRPYTGYVIGSRPTPGGPIWRLRIETGPKLTGESVTILRSSTPPDIKETAFAKFNVTTIGKPPNDQDFAVNVILTTRDRQTTNGTEQKEEKETK
ncbi:MAG: hypothetical protein A2751_01710 [Candidatus Doudnabacteria bacterium RIFCSPHIGHO2_01_FULL_46_14]|uniref:Uncharacterized protein n=1 Tax=Candidatus Doudnabacteria bacterium RIFCSPHIGHO2_01_FULL_46_14 TaxID=1817824 RepID=A0A1F5NJS6_9BACT|nr:MAG: hypothetical protein A2751_01710 [Candidatus Doudnabacteria bacterium RIFCSPHIGHO2_01_FULL_46_14]